MQTVDIANNYTMTIEKSYNTHIEKLSIEINKLEHDFAIKKINLIAKYTAKGMNRHLITVKVQSSVYRDIERINDKKSLLHILQTSKKMDC